MKLDRIACGISICPLWWQWGLQYPPSGRMFAVGPLRFAWRGWGA